VKPTRVALQPRIRIESRTGAPIREASIWDEAHKTLIAKLDSKPTSPTLTDGQKYVLSVTLADGTQWSMPMRAKASAETSVVIVVLH
jgi:hypothetical protein